MLLARLKAGQSDAFRLFFQRHAPSVHRLAALLLGERSAAEDAVQEVFLRAFRAIGAYRGEAKLSTWMHRITTNVCLSDLKRRERATQREDAAARASDLLDPVDLHASDARHDLLPLLRRLDATRRVTFLLHHVEGLSAREIAEVLDDTRDAVLKRLQRTRAQLLAAFEGEGTEDGAAVSRRADRSTV